jgi:hypothetical protein
MKSKKILLLLLLIFSFASSFHITLAQQTSELYRFASLESPYGQSTNAASTITLQEMHTAKFEKPNVDESDEVMLVLNLPKGKIYHVTANVTSEVEMLTNRVDVTKEEMKEIEMSGKKSTYQAVVSIGYDYEVKDILPNGNFLIRTTVNKIKTSVSFGKEVVMEYDSETGKGGEMGNMKNEIGKWSEIEINKNGEFIKTDLSKSSLIHDLTGESVVIFSNQKVKPGNTWMADMTFERKDLRIGGGMTVETTYKLVSVKDRVAEISLDGIYGAEKGAQGKLSGTQKGIAKIDITTGLTTEMTMDRNLEVVQINQNGAAIPMKTKSKYTLTIR